MPRSIGEETEVGAVVSETKKLDHPFFPVVSRVIQKPNGVVRDEQLVWDRGGKNFAVAMVYTTERKYVLVEEPKYGQMRRMISAPTGGVKKGEAPLIAAQRELLEETGYKAFHWESLLENPIVDFPDKSDGGGHYIFIANGAHRVQAPRNPEQTVILADENALTELITSGRMPAMSMVAALLEFKHYRRG